MSYPGQPQRSAASPGAGGSTGLAALTGQVAFGTALAGFITGLLGTSVASSTGNLTVGILIRGLLALIIVALIARVFAGRAKQGGAARPVLLIVGGALLGFLLDPLTWVARTALTQLLADPGILTLIGDLVLWLLAAGAGALLGARTATAPATAVTPYG